MHPACIDINPLPDAVRRLLRLGILGISNRQFARKDKVRRQAEVRVRRVVRVPMWLLSA